MDKYLVIENRDGDAIIKEYTKADLLKHLSGHYETENGGWFSELPSEANMKYWSYGKLLIIKGDVVAPFPKTVVKKYDIE